jgi:DNA-binding MurR/RpiR family transcriptional regulator
MERFASQQEKLTPKGRALVKYVAEHPRQAVFLRTRGLGAASGVSESTVVRVVSQLGYASYGEFIQALRDYLDRELTLTDRLDLSDSATPEADQLRQVIYHEIADLKQLYETLDVEGIHQLVEAVQKAPHVFVIGSRLSYTYAHYLGWSLSKARSGVTILAGSDSAAIDWLTTAPAGSLAVIIATSRYPNELIRLAKVAVIGGLELQLITDSPLCPLVQFARRSLVAPCRHIPLLGSPSVMCCLINCLSHELVRRGGDEVKEHQARLEQAHRENDIWFNLGGAPGGPGSRPPPSS